MVVAVPLDPMPGPLGGIRNAAHLAPYPLWRGEQPPLFGQTVAAMRGAGIEVILSLRSDGEEAGLVAGREVPDYYVAKERRYWEGHGFAFEHVPFTDFAAASAAQVAAALRVVDAHVDAGRTVYVHCRAGVGRTGLVTCAWLMSRGVDGDNSALHFLRFVDDIYVRTSDAHERTGQPMLSREEYFERVGFCEQWWALHQVAMALGQPIGRTFDAPAARPPEGAGSWAAGYESLLRPWRGA